MSNSRIITHDFDYFAPGTLPEALGILKEKKAQPFAGGTDLINNIKLDGRKPDALLYVPAIQDLNFIRENGSLEIGAAATLADIEHSAIVKEKYPALMKAINVIGGTQIRNMGTIIGNICNASPGADTPPILMVLSAEVEIFRLDSSGKISTRIVLVENFFTGPKKTVLESGELVTSIKIPFPKPGSGQSFHRLARVSLDIAKINCAVYLERRGDKIDRCVIAFGSVAPTPIRLPSAEDFFAGKGINPSALEEGARLAAEDIKPITDVRSTAEYRKQVSAVLLKQAMEEAWDMAGEE
jgi:CO/xanthine dehydrogenase FAD-binding subunit